MSETKRKKPSLAFILIATGFMVFAAWMIPNFVKARTRSSVSACYANLKMLDGAKDSWAWENKKHDSDIPTITDISGPTNYLRDIPQCPATGVYLLGRVDQKPRCSDPNHEAFLACAQAVDELGKPLPGVRFEGLADGLHLYRGKTDAQGRTALITVWDSEAERWKHGTNRFVVTKKGYRTEKSPVPNFWPLRVVLTKE